MGQNVHIPITSSADTAPIKDAEKDVKALGKTAAEAGHGSKELTHDLGEVSKAAKGTSMISHGLAELFHGNLLGAIKALSKGLKTLWLAMMENPITGVIALVGLLAPLLFKLAGAFGAGSNAAEKQAEAMKRVQDDAAKAAVELEKLNKAKLDEAVAAAKELADEWERAVKAAHELQAAQDKLTSAQMAQELAGNEAAMQSELGRAGGDKDAERRIRLKYAQSEAEIRNRYQKEEADKELKRAVGERSAIEERMRKSSEASAIAKAEADRTEADRAKRANDLQNLDIWDKNGNMDPEKAKAMQTSFAEMAIKTGSMLAAQRAKDIAEYQPSADAAAVAARKAAEAARQHQLNQNQYVVDHDAATTAIETAKLRQRAASSAGTSTQQSFRNQSGQLESQIAEEHRRAAEQEAQRAAQEMERRRRDQEQQERNALVEQSRRARVGLHEYGASYGGANMPGGVRQAIQHRMQTLSAAAGGGDTAVISALDQYHQAVEKRNKSQVAAMDRRLRELAAKIEATVTQSGH